MSTHMHIQYESSVTVATGAIDFSDPQLVEELKHLTVKDSDINWVLYGYVPKSNKLKVVGTGNGGLVELLEELSDAKALYALLKYDYNKNFKIVFITWVPDGVPTVIKGTINTHIDEVSKFIKGFHIQINARNESDLTEDIIRDKITKSAATGYGN